MDSSPTESDFLARFSNIHAGDTLYRSFAKLGSLQNSADMATRGEVSSTTQPGNMLSDIPDSISFTGEEECFQASGSELYFSRDSCSTSSRSSGRTYSDETVEEKSPPDFNEDYLSENVRHNEVGMSIDSHVLSRDSQDGTTSSDKPSSGTLSRNLSRNIPDKDISKKEPLMKRQFRSEETLFLPRSREFLRKRSLPPVRDHSYYNHTPNILSRAIYQSIVSLDEVVRWM